jgi:hypothetical protein
MLHAAHREGKPRDEMLLGLFLIIGTWAAALDAILHYLTRTTGWPQRSQ